MMTLAAAVARQAKDDLTSTIDEHRKSAVRFFHRVRTEPEFLWAGVVAHASGKDEPRHN